MIFLISVIIGDALTLNACLWFLTIPGIKVMSNSGWNLAAYANGKAEISS